MKRFLIIRFSSIGDIVLTTPIIRCIKNQYPNAEVHFLTKSSFGSLLVNNPYVDQIHLLKDNLDDLKSDLQNFHFDYVIDLHKNLRSKKVKSWLNGSQYFSFDKLNWKKFLLTRFKINKLPKVHIVDRYFAAVESLGVSNDQKGLDYFIDESIYVADLPSKYLCYAIGGTYATKRYPKEKIKEVIEKSSLPIVIIGGGNEDQIVADFLGDSCINLVNKISIDESAFVMKHAEKVITHDTGMMHIAAALKKGIISIWGNTVPDFGMTPYLPGNNSVLIENKEVSCRPCSKLGYDKCPKGHFKCMEGIGSNSITKHLD